MKNLFTAFLCLFLTGPLIAQEYEIKVKIKGSTPSEKPVYLAHYFGNSQYIKVDSSKLENGQYLFKGDKELKGGIYLIVLDPSHYYDFIFDGKERKFSIDADTSDYVGTVKFTNSKENNLLFGYRKFLKDKSGEAAQLNKAITGAKDEIEKETARQSMMQLQEEVATYMKEYIQKNQGSFAAKVVQVNQEPEIPKEVPVLANGKKDSTFAFRYYKAHFWDGMDFSDERFLRTPFLQTKLDKYFKDLVYQIQDSVIVASDYVLQKSKANKEVYRYVLWWVTNKYENIDIVGLDGVFVHLAENYYLNDADWLDEEQRKKFEDRVRVLKPLRTGLVFPELILSDTLGNVVDVAKTKGKYTIVYFYSPDCGHCKDAAPELISYHEKAKERGIWIYNIAVDYELDKIKEFIKKYKTGGMINAWDSKGKYYFREKFDIYSTPTSYILNEKRQIIGKRIPIEEFDRFIEFYEKNQATR